MERLKYIYGFELDNADMEYDVIIIGSGISGLYAACKISKDKRILLLSKDRVEESNSSLAQGGIAASLNEAEFASHIEDTLRAGCHYNDRSAVEVIVKEGRLNIESLINLGVAFDTLDDGELMATREGGHSQRRVLHHKDQTGKEIVRALIEAVKEADNISIIEDFFVVDVIVDDGICYGLTGIKDGKLVVKACKELIIATGGIGELYNNSTNSVVSNGDGVAMSIRQNMDIDDMEFVQFHPTAMYMGKNKRNFLISEAVRGEGGILRNHKGEAFMENYHELKDLAPRDIVSRAIINEIEKADKEFIYLDMTGLDVDHIDRRFPNIRKKCLEQGIDITKDYIPVCPVEHYFMGGIRIDLNGRTNIENIYSCGEVSCNRVHGANRLASNSLLDAVVFANRIADIINSDSFSISHKKINVVSLLGQIDNITEYREKIKNIMSNDAFIFRSSEKILEGIKEIKGIIYLLENNVVFSVEFVEILNMATVSYEILKAAFKRKQSIGTHKIRS